MKTALVYLNNDKYVSRGSGYVASAVLAAGHALDWWDTAYCRIEDVAKSIISGGYDLLLLSASTLFYWQAKELARLVREGSSVRIVLGGIHATILQDAVLRDCSDIDLVCVGEAEGFIVDLLNDLEQHKSLVDIPNLGYRQIDGAPVVNKPRPCTDLASLPPFKYDLFPQEAVVQNYPRPGFCYVWSTRGCPYNCSYCCNGNYLKLYGKSYLRTRPIDATIAELIYLRDHYPAKLFYFGDEMILFDAEYVDELFRRVHSDVAMPYGCMFRVESLTPEIVKLFQETGCVYVGIGIECANEEFRREFLNRRMTNQQIEETVKALRTVNGLWITTYNMRGYPVPYDDDLTRETKSFNRRLCPDHVQMSVCYPFVGTKLHQYCVEHDLIDSEKVRQVDERGQDYFSRSVLRDWK